MPGIYFSSHNKLNHSCHFSFNGVRRRKTDRSCLGMGIASVNLFVFLLTGFVNSQDISILRPSLPDNAEFTKYALLKEGDVERGRVLFESQTLACAHCHSTDGLRGKAGPDLFATGDKFGRREIIDSILTPSARIADGYETTILRTESGNVYSGIVKQATNQSIEIAVAVGGSVRIAVDDIEARRTSAVSMMPQDLHASLSLAEFNDLIEYLVSLKQSDNAARVDHGMPKKIQEISSPVALQTIIPDAIKFDKPVWMGRLPGSDGYLVIEHQMRRIWHVAGQWNVLSTDPTETVRENQKTLFLELEKAAPNEGRLSCLAPHPNFRMNRKYYLFDRPTINGKIVVTIVEREATQDGLQDSGQSPRTILEVPQTTGNHYGGWMEFGPDGYLYIGMGDSGPQEDPNGNAQNPQLFLGKILRIDVDHEESGKGYSVPSDNPFVNDREMLPEVWALGFRAPWRFCIDRISGDLWVGDVGQDRYEEVTIVRRGENHGWNVYEGFEPFSNRFRRKDQNYTAPVFAYGRKYGPSVTGGFVYRADPKSTFYGKYIFGDYESRRIFALTHQDRKLMKVRQIGLSPQRIVSFAQDESGDIYVVGYEGLLYRIDFSTAQFE